MVGGARHVHLVNTTTPNERKRAMLFIAQLQAERLSGTLTAPATDEAPDQACGAASPYASWIWRVVSTRER